MESIKITPNSDVCEGRTKASKGKRKTVDEDESSTHDEIDELDEHLAFLSRQFSELKFKRNSAALEQFKKVY